MYCVHNCQGPEYVLCLEQKSAWKGKTHRHTKQLWLNLTNRKKAYWRKMAWVWLFSCILLNTIYLLGSSTNRAVAFRLCKYYCYACEEINSLKHRKTQTLRSSIDFFFWLVPFSCQIITASILVFRLLAFLGCLFLALVWGFSFFFFFSNDFSQNSSNQTEKMHPYCDVGSFITFKKLTAFLR